jgi:hypothetical protein
MQNAYVSFRIRLARHALMELAASLRGSGQILVVLFAPVLVGLLALAALPPLYAATLPFPSACGLVLAHALVMASPVLLLRQRLMPAAVVEWLRALPVTPRVRLSADAMVAWQVARPVAALYASSLAIWIGQRPKWIDPAAGILMTLVSFALTLVGIALMLAVRTRSTHARPRVVRQPLPYVQPRVGVRPLFKWRRLYWHALWRTDGAPGMLLAALFFGAIACGWMWMHQLFALPAAGLALAHSILLVLLMDRSDKARRAQAQRLRPIAGAWPAMPATLERAAQCLGAVPGLLAVGSLWLLGSAGGAWQHTSGRWYLGLAILAQLVLAAVPVFSARGRVGTVALSMLILTAVGGEIWQ